MMVTMQKALLSLCFQRIMHLYISLKFLDMFQNDFKSMLITLLSLSAIQEVLITYLKYVLFETGSCYRAQTGCTLTASLLPQLLNAECQVCTALPGFRNIPNSIFH